MRIRRGATLFELLLVVAAALVLFEVAVYARRAHGAERSPVVMMSQRQGAFFVHASGTVIGRIDERSVGIATCAHGWRLNEAVCVQIGGACRAARFEGHRFDKSADAAVVRLPLAAPLTWPCYRLGTVPPVGSRVVRIGYPSALARLSSGNLTSMSGAWLWSSGAAQQGESGGAVLAIDESGAGTLVGVITATARDTQVATSAEVVRELAIGAWGRLPTCGTPEPDVAPLPPPDVPIAPPPPEDPPRLVPVPDPRFAAIEARLAALEQRAAVPGPAGPAGPPGPQGPVGPQGVPGPQGAAGVVDAASLNAIKGRLDRLDAIRIPVQILDESGRVIDSESVPLGEPIKLRGIYRVREKPSANP